MNKILKRTFIIFVTILGLFFIGSQIRIFAAQSLSMTDGAQIRTTGERQGLRFTATASEAFAEGSEHGFYVALGEHTLEAMTTAIQASSITVGSNKLVKKIIEGEDLTFNLVIYNIPEASYKQDITAIPYIKEGEVYTFPSLSVTRNIAEIAVAAYSSYGSEVPAIVASAATQRVNYNMNGGAFVGDKEFTITKYNSGSDGLTINLNNTTTNLVNYNWYVLYLNTTSNPNVFEIITYTTSGVALYTGDFDYVIGAHDGCTDTVGRNIIKTLMAESSVGMYIHLSSVPTTSGIVSVKAKVFASTDFNHACEATSQGHTSAVTLKSISKNYYDFAGWYTNSEFTGDAVTNIAAGNSGSTINLYGKFTPTVYGITYELNNGNCFDGSRTTSYTYESAVISLPANETMSREGYTFNGWFDNSAFTGSAVTNIAAGSNGDKTFYAQWIANETPQYEVNSDDVRVLNLVTPTIIVNSSLNNGSKYILSGTGLSSGYEELELTGYSTISDAVAAATTGSTIYVTASTYSSTLTLSAASLNLIGPNYNIHGNDTRTTEAVVSGAVTITGASTTIDGLQFTGSGAIKVSANNVTINHIYTNATQIACKGQNRKGCIVDGANMSGLQVLNSYISASTIYLGGFMAFNYANGLVIKDNYITNVATSNSAEGMMIYSMAGTFTFEGNDVHFGTIGYLLKLANTSNTCTAINIIDNYFTGNASLTSCSILISYGTSSLTTTIRGNQFINFAPNTYLFTNDTGSTVNITYNYYNAQQLYRVTTKSSAILNLNYNCYLGGIDATDVSGASAEATKFATYAELQTAYEAFLAG